MNIKNSYPLKGLKIGISGAIPERETWKNKALDYEILNFVRTFSGLVMKYGGTIVHGSHPAFTPILLKLSQQHLREGEKFPLKLFMSKLWEDYYSASQLEYYKTNSDLTLTNKIGIGTATDKETINSSLTQMRTELISEMDLFIAIGGKLHTNSGINPGVEQEHSLAMMANVPCIILPALEGKASDLVPEDSWFESMQRGSPLYNVPKIIHDICSTINLTVDKLLPELKNLKLPEVLNIEIEDIAMYPSVLFDYCIQYNKLIDEVKHIAQTFNDNDNNLQQFITV